VVGPEGCAALCDVGHSLDLSPVKTPRAIFLEPVCASVVIIRLVGILAKYRAFVRADLEVARLLDLGTRQMIDVAACNYRVLPDNHAPSGLVIAL
jgi:hypothetical protein